MLVAALPLVFGSVGPSVADVREFARLYRSSSVEQAFDLLADSLAHRPARVTEDDWMAPYAKAVGEKAFDANEDRFPDARFLSLTVGKIERLAVLNASGRPYRLPTRLRAPAPWQILPLRLGAGRYVLVEYSTESEGMNCPRNLDWLRLSGTVGQVVGRFEGTYNLDEPEPTARGDVVSEVYEPESRGLAVSGGMVFLESRRTWNWRDGRPVLVSDRVLYPRRKALDDAIADAATARRPTRLQVKIRRLMRPQKLDDDPQYMVDMWTESGNRFNLDGVVFRLTRTANGYRVASVRETTVPSYLR